MTFSLVLSEFLSYTTVMIIDDRFDGVKRIYSPSSFEILQNAHIAIVGLGGIGTWACESLARSGVGKVTLVDLDDICISNTNRQIHALDGNYGKLKVHAMKERIHAINPSCEVNLIEDFFSESSCESFFTEKYDYVIDCIDSVKSKCTLIAECKKREIKILTTGGAGGKMDPRYVTVKDLNKTNNDKLLHIVRTNLKRFYNFPKTKAAFNIPCVFSPEFKTEPQIDKGTKSTNCQNGVGSLAHVTGTFGFMAAGFVINDLLMKNPQAEFKNA